MASDRRARPRSQGARSTRRRLLSLLATLLLVATALGSYYWLWPTPAAIERQWIEHAGFDPRIAYPSRDTDEAAGRIEASVARLGFQIDPSRPVWRRSPEGARDRFAAIRPELQGYVRAIRRSEPEIGPPPHDLSAFLREVEPILGEIAGVLVASETPPRWELRLDRSPEDRVPNWLDHLSLHSLLLASAAEAEHRGRDRDSRRWLEAAWRLRETLDDDPTLLAQLVALAELHDELAFLRAIPGLLPDREHRLAPIPMRQRMITAMRLETWSLPSSLRQFPAEDFFPLDHPERPPAILARLQARRGAAAIVAGVHRFADHLESAEHTPTEVVAAVSEQLERIPRWNVIAWTFWPSPISFGEVWRKAARVELNLELDRRILEVRKLLRAGDTEALQGLSGEQPSVVSGVYWTYRIGPGAVVIRAGGDVEPLAQEGALPLEIRFVRIGVGNEGEAPRGSEALTDARP